MSKNESTVGTAIGPHSEEYREERVERRPGGGVFGIVKPGQGLHVRWGTAIGAGLLALAGAWFIRDQIQIIDLGDPYNFYVRTLVPVVLLLAMLYGIFYLVARKPAVVDFLIATEGEMKKVNWSTRREVWGATKVVIVTVLALGVMLFLVDALLMSFFGGIGVLKDVKLFQTFMGEPM